MNPWGLSFHFLTLLANWTCNRFRKCSLITACAPYFCFRSCSWICSFNAIWIHCYYWKSCINYDMEKAHFYLFLLLEVYSFCSFKASHCSCSLYFGISFEYHLPENVFADFLWKAVLNCSYWRDWIPSCFGSD
jgi:hypothetical protein